MDFEALAAMLEAVVEDRGLLADLDPELRKRLLIAAGKVARPDKAAKRRLSRTHRRQDKARKREDDRALLDRAGIRELRRNPIFQTPRKRSTTEPERPPIGSLHEARACYCCQADYTDVHWFYDQLCPACAELNYAKRSPEADLSGRVALVTGSRVKIGYQAAILLLRNGAHVIVTTRFPVDAAERYAAEPDFAEFADRLTIHGIDLRHTPSVEQLCQQILDEHDRLDFLINNACQTVRRPPGFYEHMMPKELAGSSPETMALVASQRSKQTLSSAEMTQIPMVDDDYLDPRALFPKGRLDADLQQVDLRRVNSWRLRLDQVPTIELLEVHLVNAVAPFVLNARLKPLMARVPTNDAHIVNVSAMEGQFYRTFKSDKHPHTNMAKAALNMMTRTSAIDYVRDGIHMNSVDTGWVTDEDPVEHADRKRDEHGFHPPLDIVDGAARIVDPIFDGLTSGDHVWGQFLKDYKVCDW